jgi:hypothetical protein
MFNCCFKTKTLSSESNTTIYNSLIKEDKNNEDKNNEDKNNEDNKSEYKSKKNTSNSNSFSYKESNNYGGNDDGSIFSSFMNNYGGIGGISSCSQHFKKIKALNNKYNSSVKEKIKELSPIDNHLHVIAVISNPCNFIKRELLMKKFIETISTDNNIILYIVELIYEGLNDTFHITDANNKRHLQIKTSTPLWHKENMINLGINKLLPPDWKAFAWIDADLEFENHSWALDTLKILNGYKNIIQLFSQCLDNDNEHRIMKIHTSAGFQYHKHGPFFKNGINYSHPGYAWAMNRELYDSIKDELGNCIYDKAILGSGDNILLKSIFGCVLNSISDSSTNDYKNSLLEYQNRINKVNINFGYTPGVILHNFHGSKINRKYTERWKILLNHNYSPDLHIKYDEDGIIIPTSSFSNEFKKDILNYFLSRNEDE